MVFSSSFLCVFNGFTAAFKLTEHTPIHWPRANATQLSEVCRCLKESSAFSIINHLISLENDFITLQTTNYLHVHSLLWDRPSKKATYASGLEHQKNKVKRSALAIWDPDLSKSMLSMVCLIFSTTSCDWQVSDVHLSAKVQVDWLTVSIRYRRNRRNMFEKTVSQELEKQILKWTANAEELVDLKNAALVTTILSVESVTNMEKSLSAGLSCPIGCRVCIGMDLSDVRDVDTGWTWMIFATCWPAIYHCSCCYSITDIFLGHKWRLHDLMLQQSLIIKQDPQMCFWPALQNTGLGFVLELSRYSFLSAPKKNTAPKAKSKGPLKHPSNSSNQCSVWGIMRVTRWMSAKTWDFGLPKRLKCMERMDALSSLAKRPKSWPSLPLSLSSGSCFQLSFQRNFNERNIKQPSKKSGRFTNPVDSGYLSLLKDLGLPGFRSSVRSWSKLCWASQGTNWASSTHSTQSNFFEMKPFGIKPFTEQQSFCPSTTKLTWKGEDPAVWFLGKVRRSISRLTEARDVLEKFGHHVSKDFRETKSSIENYRETFWLFEVTNRNVSSAGRLACG